MSEAFSNVADLFAKGSVPSWGLLLVAFGMALKYVIPWRRLNMDEVILLKKEMVDIRAEMLRTNAQCTAFTIRVEQLQFCLELAMTEIETSIPGSKVPSQIRQLLAITHPLPPSGVPQDMMDKLRGLK